MSLAGTRGPSDDSDRVAPHACETVIVSRTGTERIVVKLAREDELAIASERVLRVPWRSGERKGLISLAYEFGDSYGRAISFEDVDAAITLPWERWELERGQDARFIPLANIETALTVLRAAIRRPRTLAKRIVNHLYDGPRDCVDGMIESTRAVVRANAAASPSRVDEPTGPEERVAQIIAQLYRFARKAQREGRIVIVVWQS